ncbi:MAG: phospho-N-acetylmuramoyl-pentapeptide-transferase [Bacilli bacterium]|nr:phospho-N-acetylmuramoyl-pentapeptide-transferase [Bacilli bacterium]
MLILTKSVFAMMIGFILSSVLGLILIPFIRNLRASQRISIYVGESHHKKEGTPTMGGFIFVLATLITIIFLLITNKIVMTGNLLIVLVVFVGYSLLGFLDDYLSIKRKDNEGLTTMQKLFGQFIIALLFFFIYMKSGAEPLLWVHTLGLKVNLGWLYGVFILLLLVGMSNAVNITDGLDGLAGGLTAISFLAFGLIAWGAGWVSGHDSIAIFCFVLVGALLGFLVYNTYPAKIFMGDTGSLTLGGTLAAIAILAHYEVTLFVVGGVFIIETLSVIIQYASVKLTGKKVFLMSPLHHHFEKLGWEERDIVKLFWIMGLLFAMASLTFGVWI